MFRNLKNVLFVLSVVMVFTAQTYRPDEKGQQRGGQQPRTAPVTHNSPSRPQAQTQSRRQAPVHVVRREMAIDRSPIAQPSRPEREMPRVYAVPFSAPVDNGRLLHRQHHNNWQPLYNYYDQQYHFYPYVSIVSTVEFSANCVTVGFNGQTYYYDRGRFYQQDGQGGYLAVVPPIGIIVNAIPSHARPINADGQNYYRYKGVFYVQLEEGYQVVGPLQASSGDA